MWAKNPLGYVFRTSNIFIVGVRVIKIPQDWSSFPFHFFYMNPILKWNIFQYGHWPCFICTCCETLSVLALAKQWAAVSTQFWLTMDPKQDADCTVKKVCVWKSTLKYQTSCFRFWQCSSLTAVTVTVTCQGLVYASVTSFWSWEVSSWATPHIVTLLSPNKTQPFMHFDSQGHIGQCAIIIYSLLF